MACRPHQRTSFISNTSELTPRIATSMCPPRIMSKDSAESATEVRPVHPACRHCNKRTKDGSTGNQCHGFLPSVNQIAETLYVSDFQVAGNVLSRHTHQLAPSWGTAPFPGSHFHSATRLACRVPNTETGVHSLSSTFRKADSRNNAPQGLTSASQYPS